jgi:hypothetical protein
MSNTKIPFERWHDRSIPAATATAAPSAMIAAVSGAIAASIFASVAAPAAAAATTVAAALPGGVPFPATSVPAVLDVEAAAIAHPCPLVETPLVAATAGASAARRAAVSPLLPYLSQIY